MIPKPHSDGSLSGRPPTAAGPNAPRRPVWILLAGLLSGVAGWLGYVLASQLYVVAPPPTLGNNSTTPADTSLTALPAYKQGMLNVESLNSAWRLAVVGVVAPTIFFLLLAVFQRSTERMWKPLLLILVSGSFLGAAGGTLNYLAGRQFDDLMFEFAIGSPNGFHAIFREVYIGILTWLPIAVALALAAVPALRLRRQWKPLIASAGIAVVFAALVYPLIAALAFPLQKSDELPTGLANQALWIILPAACVAISTIFCLRSAGRPMTR